MDATETEELEKIRKKAMDEVTSALQALENKFQVLLRAQQLWRGQA